MMGFAIMNILTGICVNHANRVAEEDFELSFHAERTKHRAVLASLKTILHNADQSGQGTITWSTLEELLDDQDVRNLFKKIDLESFHLKHFFDLMGDDNSAANIEIEQFLRGCMRLRCNVKNIDLMAGVHQEAAKTAKHLNDLQSSVAEIHVILRGQGQKTCSRLDHENDLDRSASRRNTPGYTELPGVVPDFLAPQISP